MLRGALAWWVSFPFQEKLVSRIPNPELARQWRDRLGRFEQAKLTVAEFCQLEGVSVASFYQWRRRLAGEPTGGQPEAFVPVELPQAVSAMPGHVDSGQGVELRIELPGGGLLRLVAEATDSQQCRLIKNVIRSIAEVAR